VKWLKKTVGFKVFFCGGGGNGTLSNVTSGKQKLEN
jgi:hypothetical protein